MKKFSLFVLIAMCIVTKNSMAQDQCSNNFSNAKIVNTTINNIVIQCGEEKIDLPIVTLTAPYATDDEEDLKYIANKFAELRKLERKIIYFAFSIHSGWLYENKGPSIDQAHDQGYKTAYAGITSNLIPFLDGFFGNRDDYEYIYQLDIGFSDDNILEATDGLRYLSLLLPKKYTSSFKIKSGRDYIYGSGLARIEFSGFNGGVAFFEVFPIEAQGPYLSSYQGILDKINSGEIVLERRDWNKNNLEYDKLYDSEPVSSEPVSSEPVSSEPVSSEPVSSEPVSSEPVSSEPVSSEPVSSRHDPVANMKAESSGKECSLIVASRRTLPEVRQYIHENITDRRYLKVLIASNGWYAISIGSLKPNEEEPVMRKWKASGKIPQDSFCATSEKIITEVEWDF